MNRLLFVTDGRLYQAYFWSKDDIVAIEYLNQFNEWVPIERHLHANYRGNLAGWQGAKPC